MFVAQTKLDLIKKNRIFFFNLRSYKFNSQPQVARDDLFCCKTMKQRPKNMEKPFDVIKLSHVEIGCLKNVYLMFIQSFLALYPTLTLVFLSFSCFRYLDMVSNFCCSCYMNDAKQVSRSTILFLVLLKLLIFVFLFSWKKCIIYVD